MASDNVGRDFTEGGYMDLILEAQRRFDFVDFEHLHPESIGIAVWRHDVDISPQRALRIASLDARAGVKSYFFFQLTSIFYSPLEPGFKNILAQIGNYGHHVGLHYDPACSSGDSVDDLIARLTWESALLAEILGHDVTSFSIHNPTVSGGFLLERQVAGGLLNASWSGWHSMATYCSDSNGYWRFQDAQSLIRSENTRNLYLLTHPEWWTPTRGDAFLAVRRAIDGRARSNLDQYRQLLKEHGRPFLGDKESLEFPTPSV